ncbi:Retrovirus-related Pol polyprotein from transposon opus, partial [Mucuna pruriens]
MYYHDEEKTTFIIDAWAFCYKVTPFGHKSTGATYQWLMDKIFKEIIGVDVELYVDDMVVKSAVTDKHCKVLERVFGILRRHQLHLNPEKCSFGVQVGKFLGYMLIDRGIEANPEKCQAIIGMRSPQNVREVQQLMGRVTALSHFISRVVETAIPFGFNLTNSNTVLIQEKKREQRPVYYTSKVLQGAKKRKGHPRLGNNFVEIAPVPSRVRHNRQNKSPNMTSTAKAKLGQKDGCLERPAVKVQHIIREEGPHESTSTG